MNCRVKPRHAVSFGLMLRHTALPYCRWQTFPWQTELLCLRFYCCTHFIALVLLLISGVENAFYEGPLRLRLPVNMRLDPDGAFSFELPLPSPQGNLSVVSLWQPLSFIVQCFGDKGCVDWLLAASVAVLCLCAVVTFLVTSTDSHHYYIWWRTVDHLPWSTAPWIALSAVCGRLQKPCHPVAPAPTTTGDQLDSTHRRPKSGCRHASKQWLWWVLTVGWRCIACGCLHAGSCELCSSMWCRMFVCHGRQATWHYCWGMNLQVTTADLLPALARVYVQSQVAGALQAIRDVLLGAWGAHHGAGVRGRRELANVSHATCFCMLMPFCYGWQFSVVCTA